MNSKIFTLFIALLLLITPTLANTPNVGTGIDTVIEPEDFLPLIWMNPHSRIFYFNPADGSREGIERIGNYAFEGEQISWDVLVMDKNGIEKISDVYVTIGPVQGIGNDIEANCDLANYDEIDISVYNARILEEQITEFDEDTMAVYTCRITVETTNSMQGGYWVVAEVEDLDGNQATFDENEYWHFNPDLSIEVEGAISFQNVRPGTAAYSETIRVTNTGDDGSGILLDMRISGTDFYDPSSSGTKCPVSNRIRLNSGGESPFYTTRNINPSGDFIRTEQTNCDNPYFSENPGDVDEDLGTETDFDALCYFASKGDYSTAGDTIRRDVEGYVGIPYETGEETDRAPIISDTFIPVGFYFPGNSIVPGEDIAITFRLFLPEPCNGEAFTDGTIYFWAEAV